MKALNVLAATLLAFSATIATADQSSSAPTGPAARGILHMRSFGGMPGPQGPMTHEMTLMSDGSVVVETQSYKGTAVVREIKTLPGVETLERVTKLADVSNKLRKGELDQFQGPGCFDAPSTSYGAVRGSSEVRFGLNEQCRLLLLKSQRNTAKKLVEYMNELRGRVYELTDKIDHMER